MVKTELSPRVRVAVELLRRLTTQELAQLKALVPALQGVGKQPSITAEDESLRAHFRQLGIQQRGGRSAALDGPFIGGLTYADYFALSDIGQDAFWAHLFSELSLNMELMEEQDLVV